jgi:hypothetical protein
MGALHGVLDNRVESTEHIEKQGVLGLVAKQTDVTVTLLETALCMGWHEWAGMVGMDLDSNSLILHTS